MSANAQQSVYNATDTDLPEGWAQAEVSELLTLLNGYPFKPSQWKGRGRPIIRIQNLNNPDARFNYCPDDIPRKYIVRTGDLLFAWSGTPGTSFGAHIWGGGEAWLNQHIFRVDFEEAFLDRRFLKLAINRNLDDYIDQAHGGVGLAHITKGKFDASYLPIAPLPEQKRIVAKVEDLLTHVNATRDRLTNVPKILKCFRQSVLAAACSGQLTADWRNQEIGSESGAGFVERVAGLKAVATVPDDEDPVDLPTLPEEWTWSRCEHLCVPARAITYGVIKLGPSFGKGVPTLRSSDVRWLHIDDIDVKRISPTIATDYSRTLLQGGEILVTVRGSLGGVAVVPARMAGFNISREVAMLPLYPQFNAQFFCYAIASVWSQNWLSEVTKGVAYTGVNIRDLKRLPLPVPPLGEQIEIVRRIEALFKLADTIEERVEAATKRADKLTQAIMAKAFRGELVPTEAQLARREGRDYEPASILLERIKADGVSTGTQTISPRARHNPKRIGKRVVNKAIGRQ